MSRRSPSALYRLAHAVEGPDSRNEHYPLCDYALYDHKMGRKAKMVTCLECIRVIDYKVAGTRGRVTRDVYDERAAYLTRKR